MIFLSNASRLVPYWLTVVVAYWCIAFQYAWNSSNAYETIDSGMIAPLFAGINQPTAVDWSFVLIAFLVPPLFAAAFSYLLISNNALPVKTWSWVTNLLAFRKFPQIAAAQEGHQIHKKNQFLKGEVDFNIMSLWLIGIPAVVSYLWVLPSSLNYVNEENEEFGWDDRRLTRERTFYVSMLSGWQGIFTLTWFLIPVTRHSVLLVAMGWSPVHALRLHIWAGHLSFFFEFIHTATMVAVWFMDNFPVYESFIPPAKCWGWNASNVESEHEHRRKAEEMDSGEFVATCNYQWYNLTGILAMVMFIVLWVSSLHWFRRRNYRVFYLMHVTFGSLTLIATVLHYAYIVIYWLPSITYYLASTTPTLIQALASRFRGGVKISKVIPLENASGCVEVHVATNGESAASLNREPSQFVKLCVPKISVVWHPFTVFAHPTDPTTLRFLFRPIGPFTKELAKHLTAPSKPVTMLDGFYKGANRCQEALAHDCVTIVCGGVAVTPFLSMIPALFAELSMSTSEDCPLKVISVRWACREEGLMKHIANNYFAFFQEQARALGKVKLEITIYCTSPTKVNGIKENRNSMIASPLDVTEPLNLDSESQFIGEVETSGHIKGSTVDSSTCEIIDEVTDMDDVDEKEKNMEETYPSVKDPLDSTEEIGGTMEHTQGFPMEVGRMMPGRFSKFYFNIPVFVAFNIAVWCGFAVIFETYGWNHSENFKQMAATCVMTIVMTAMLGVFGVLVEVTVLHLRKYWPTPTYDDFVVYIPPSDGEATELNLTLGESEYTSFKTVHGRPTGEQILATANQYEAPGIFMCGPVPMVEMVRKETNKENTWFGRTRYCLYDEPFEF